MSQQVDTLFTGGSVYFPGADALSPPRPSRSPAGGSPRSGPTTSWPSSPDRTPTSSISPAGCCSRASRTRTSTR